jgi:hypothetical protein
MQFPSFPATLEPSLDTLFASDGLSYSCDEFQEYFGSYGRRWEMACAVTRQVCRIVELMSTIAVPVDALIFCVEKEQKVAMTPQAKYEQLARSAVIPLYWRINVLCDWDLPWDVVLEKPSVETAWELWKRHFFNCEASPAQRARGKHACRSDHAAMVRRTAGSVTWAKTLIGVGVYATATLERELRANLARRDPSEL